MQSKYKLVKELPEPITALCTFKEFVIVACGGAIYKARLPDGEILYQCEFAVFDNKDGDI